MRNRATIAAVTATASLALAGLGISTAQASTTCTWGGTPAAPTGTFTLSPGLTNTPSSGPLAFRATGTVSGGGPCQGQRFTFVGAFNQGSSCQVVSAQGRAKGLPGVVRFAGAFGGFDPAAVGPTLLYDSAGDVVGAENADVLTSNPSAAEDCGTPQGVTGGSFSSVIELTG
jgi:hypothetical protein